MCVLEGRGMAEVGVGLKAKTTQCAERQQASGAQKGGQAGQPSVDR